MPRIDSMRWNAPPIAPPIAPMTMARMTASEMLRTGVRWASFSISFVYWSWKRKTTSSVPKKKISAISGWITPRW